MNDSVKAKDARSKAFIATVGVLGFYFPGHATAVDNLSGVPYLGNFWKVSPFMFAPPKRKDALLFTNAEAAFHACKFWKAGKQKKFSLIDGGASYRLKRKLRGKEDYRYDGFGSSWRAMRAVLELKFAPGSDLAKLLISTGDTFLVEHDETVRDASVWGSNKDGSGRNWLGAMLMLYRDMLKKQATVIERYLPKTKGFPSVRLLRPEGHNAWRVICKHGLLYRLSKSYDDRDPSGRSTTQGEVVRGFDEGDWVRVRIEDGATSSRQSWSSFIEATLDDKEGPKHKAWRNMVKVATRALNDATDTKRMQRKAETGKQHGRRRR